MSIITNISTVATTEMALQRAHRPLGFSACQTTSQRLKTTTAELVKPAEMHNNNASQRSDDHWDANNFFSKKSCISAVRSTAEMQDNFIFYNILHLNGRADRWDAHIWLKKTSLFSWYYYKHFSGRDRWNGTTARTRGRWDLVRVKQHPNG